MDENTKLLIQLTQSLATQTAILTDVRSRISGIEAGMKHLENRVDAHDMALSQQQGVRKGMMLILTVAGTVVGLLGGLLSFRILFTP